MAISTRKIGSLTVNPIGLGCMGMSDFYGPKDDAQSRVTLQHALDTGVDHFDTADTYGIGHNEELIASVLNASPKRSPVTVATKFGIIRKPGSYERRIDNSPAYIRQACDASLARLGVDVIDLYYLHRWDETSKLEDAVGTMGDLVRAGKVREIGLCECSPEVIRAAAAVHPIAAIQSEYSLWTRDPEVNGVLDTCEELGIAFVAYSPIGRGFLTGAFASDQQFPEGDMRRTLPRFQPQNLEQNVAVLPRMRDMAREKGCTPAQLALAALLARRPFVVVIPGTRRPERLDENLAAARVAITAEDLERLDALLPPGAALGGRYTSEGMKGIRG